VSVPILSVVVPSFNSEKYVEEALISIQESQHPDVDFIFMDGGSSDGTMQIVEKYKHLFSHVISEPDKGQSEAFNKGFRLTQGEYLTWLNTDDVFCPGAIVKVVNSIKKTMQPWYAANVVYIDSKSKITRCCRSGAFESWALKFGILNVFGPSTIFHRDLYARMGGFREDFHFCMDTEYWWRLATNGIRYERLPIYLWALRLHEDAKTAASIQHGLDARPPGMKKENEHNRETYSPTVSTRLRKLGVILARGYRILNLSYIKSLYSTFRYKGVKLDDLQSVR
jgi:glycosyltransferase involved in cell wall biosynthesis